MVDQYVQAGENPPASLGSSSHTDVYAKIAWRLVPLLIFIFILAWLDRVNIGFAKLQMLQDLKFSDAVYGLGAGIFFIGYFLFEIPSNLLMHRIGARKTMMRITVCWGVVSTLMMFVKTPMSFYALRFLLGVCEAGFFPGVILYLTYWFPSKRRAKVNALFMTSFALAGAVGGPIAGTIMSMMGNVGGMASWQWLFLLEGIPSILAGLFLVRMLPDRPANAAWLNEHEKASVTGELEAEKKLIVAHSSLLSVMKNPHLWLCAAIFFCLVGGNAIISFWVPSVIKELGEQNVLLIGILSSVPFALGAVAMVLNGSHSDRTGERRLHCAGFSLLAVFGLAMTGVMLASAKIAFLMLVVAGIGVLGAMPVFWSFPASFLKDEAAAGGIGVINAVANLSGFFAPVAMGYLRTTTGSVASGLYLAAGLECIAALLILTFVKRTPK